MTEKVSEPVTEAATPCIIKAKSYQLPSTSEEQGRRQELKLGGGGAKINKYSDY